MKTITKSLKEVCNVDWGNTSLTKKSYVNNGKFLGVSAAGADGKMNHFEHEIGATVISAIGANCGRVFFPEDKFTAIKNTITLTPNVEIIYPKYLFFSLQNNRFPKRGAGQPFITKGDVERYQVSFPNLSEQKRIVEILERADVLRKKRMESDELSKKIIQSIFLKMFGNPILNNKCLKKQKLGSICQFAYGESLSEKKRIPGEINVYGSNGIVGKHNVAITKGATIIIGRKGSVGKVNFSPEHSFPIDTTFYIDKDNTEQNLIWLRWLLEFIKLERLTIAVGVPGLNRNHAYGLEIPVPQIPEQQKFADLVQKVEEIKERQQKSKQELGNLFNSLMQKSFGNALS